MSLLILEYNSEVINVHIIVNAGVHNNENNFNFKLLGLKTHSSIVVRVVASESECPGSSPD